MKSTIVSGAILLAAPFQALAETPSFNFVEAGYVSNIGDGPGFVDTDFDGFEIRGNLDINENIYINLAYTNLNDNSLSLSPVNSELLTVGLGHKTNISEVSTLFVEADLLKQRSDRGQLGDFFNNGYQVGFGVRSNVTESVEIRAAGYYRDLFTNNTFFQLGAVYKLTARSGVYLDVESDFDNSRYSVGVRFLFDN